jgi:hypothetical protein
MQLVLRGRSFGQDIVNVLHFEASGAQELLIPTDSDKQAWAQAVAAGWISGQRTAFLSQKPVDYTLLDVVAQVVEKNGVGHGKLAETENAMSVAGAVTQNAENNIDAAVIRFKSVASGKHSRGRMYYGPLNPDMTSQGQLVSAVITALGVIFNGLLTAYSGATPTDGALLTVYSRPLHAGEQQWTVRIGGTLTVKSNPTAYAGNSNNVTAVQVDPIVRSQRRREIGVGS